MKQFSVIVIPDGSDTPVKFWVSSGWVFGIIFSLLIFAAANIGFLTWNILNSYDRAHILHENQLLEENLTRTQSRVDSLASMLGSLSEKNRALYVITDIEEPDKNFAIGGPQFEIIEGNYSLARLELQLDSLIFVAAQEYKTMDSVSKVIEHRDKVLRHTPSIRPMPGFVSSGFGKRLDPLTGTWRMHEGIDICAPRGTKIYATADGRVKFAGNRSGFGKVVIIDHIWFETRYAHLNEIKVRKGQKVERGDVVGTCGRTGRVTGVHLHYEVRIAGKPVNPKNYILPYNICVD